MKYIAETGKPMIISTGAATIDDVRRAHDAIMPINSQLAILQCTAEYPVGYEDMNLDVITTYMNEFPDAVIGLSDHDNGIAMALVAYVLGARVIEKHFTLNRAWKGTVHAFSLVSGGMRRLVRDIRRAAISMGDGVKSVAEDEKSARHKMGKKMVFARDFPAGHVIQVGDLEFKTPGDGLPPYEDGKFYGKALVRAVAEEEDLNFDHV